MTLSPNTMLEGRYRIEAMLSRGGMGTVYRSLDTNLETRVAIKENAFQTEEAVAQFKREALILARLRHPSLPRVIQHFTVGHKQYLVMDFIEGADLWQIIENQRHPLHETQAITYISQICGALAYLHHQSPPIVHRDIKPQNIKITPDGRAVLVDFGIAKEYVSGEQTMTGARGVTAGFSPPEQYGDGGTTPASDIYSLGATMYALLTGKKPPDSVSLVVKTKQFIPVNQINPAINPDISHAISWAMELDTTRRPPTILAWQQRLQDIEIKDSVSTVASAGPAFDPTVLDLDQATPTGRGQAWLVDEQGNKYPLSSGKQLTIGRQSINDISLNSKQVSRRHAIVTLQDKRCLVYDQGSSNGTFINKNRVSSKGAELRPGAILSIGSISFRLEFSADPQPAPPAPASVSQGYTPSPASRPIQVIRDDEAELGGIAGMTQMLTVNIAKKMGAMSNIQVAILAAGLIGGLTLATILIGDFIRTNLPWVWNFFPFYLIAGPLAYVFSRRRGAALLVHIPTYVLILTIIWWPNVQLLAFFVSGFVGGAIMEALFGLPRLPDWLRYPLGVTLAYLAGLLMLIILTRPIYNYWEIVGAALLGFLIYVISEVYKGVQKARSAPNWA